MLYFKVDTKHTYLIIQPAEIIKSIIMIIYLVLCFWSFDEYKSDIYSVSAVILVLSRIFDS